MARICLGAEKNPIMRRSAHRVGQQFQRWDESIALAAMYTANHFPGVKAIIALTESGYTPLVMSRIRSPMPIYAFTSSAQTQARVALFRGVYTIPFDPSGPFTNSVSQAAVDELVKRGVVQENDWVILTKGDSFHTVGGTNTMKLLHVGHII
jgi:pyruvate kinase